MSVAPDKTHPPPLIDSDAVLVLAIAFQCFQPVPRRDAKVVQLRRTVEHDQLAVGRPLKVRREQLGPATFKYDLCVFARK